MASLRFLVTFKIKIRDQNQYGSGLMVFIRKDIPFKMLSSETSPTEGICIELNFRKKNWLLFGSGNGKKNKISNFLNVFRRILELYFGNNENLILTEDLNEEANQGCIKRFFETYS